MRVAFLTRTFPLTSETFIVSQIATLLGLGHEVEIFSNDRPAPGGPHHPDVVRYKLLGKTHYISMPDDAAVWEMPVKPLLGRTWLPGEARAKWNVLRVLRAAPALTRALTRAPKLAVEVLDESLYGYEARSMSSVYRLASVAERRSKFDIIHAHFGPVGNSFRFTRALWKAPLVVTFHGYDFSAIPQRHGDDVYQHLFACADLITGNSDYALTRLLQLGCPPSKLHKLPVGIDLDAIRFEERRSRAEGPVRLLSVGRLVEKKGVEYAIRAIADPLVREHVILEIIGDGPLRPSLEQLARDLGVIEKVTFHGARDVTFVRSRLAEASIFLLPSVTAKDGDQEGTPVSLMEAQAAGLPVISTRHSGIPEVVIDGRSGLLVPERDAGALASAIYLLVSQPGWWASFGRCGRKHVADRFDIQKLTQELTQLYDEARTRFHRLK